MPSLNDVLKEILGREPTKDDYLNDDLMERASKAMKETQEGRWTEETKKEFGLAETPDKQRELDEAAGPVDPESGGGESKA